MRRFSLLVILFLLAIPLLAACGGDDDEPADPADTQTETETEDEAAADADSNGDADFRVTIRVEADSIEDVIIDNGRYVTQAASNPSGTQHADRFAMLLYDELGLGGTNINMYNIPRNPEAGVTYDIIEHDVFGATTEPHATVFKMGGGGFNVRSASGTLTVTEENGLYSGSLEWIGEDDDGEEFRVSATFENIPEAPPLEEASDD